MAGIEFCLRYSLYIPPLAGDIEVNFLGIITRLSIDLTDGFAVDEFNVAPKNICQEQAEDAFGVEAYFCEKGNEADDTYAPLALNQGDLVRICVRPDSEARQLGLRIRRVRNATFTMGDLTQRAILEISQPAPNGLTEVGCVPGYGICWYETLLFAPFFAAPGFVQCEGAADLQFGGQPINSVSPWGFTRRALRGDEDYLDTNTFGRELQEEDVPTATFEVGANVNRGPKYGASGASSTTVMRSFFYVGAAAVLGVSYLF